MNVRVTEAMTQHTPSCDVLSLLCPLRARVEACKGMGHHKDKGGGERERGGRETVRVHCHVINIIGTRKRGEGTPLAIIAIGTREKRERERMDMNGMGSK